jgi:hypothetical protein
MFKVQGLMKEACEVEAGTLNVSLADWKEKRDG